MPAEYHSVCGKSFRLAKQSRLRSSFRYTKPWLMRTLAAYLKKPGSKSLTALSVELGVSKGRLSQLRDATEWPPEMALKIEAATKGALNASKLSTLVAQARKRAA